MPSLPRAQPPSVATHRPSSIESLDSSDAPVSERMKNTSPVARHYRALYVARRRQHDDLARRRVLAVKNDAPADRIFVWKVNLRECFTDDHHLRRIRRIAVSENASTQECDVHGSEIVAAGDRVVSNRFLAWFVWLATFDLKAYLDIVFT